MRFTDPVVIVDGLLYLLISSAAFLLAARLYRQLPGRAAELPFVPHAADGAPPVRYTLRGMLLLLTLVALWLGLRLSASQMFGSLLLLLTLLHLLVATRWLQVPRQVVGSRLVRLYRFHPMLNLLLAFAGGLLAIAIGDAVAGGLGRGWAMSGDYGSSLERDWPAVLLLLCGAYLTFAGHRTSVISDRAGWYRSLLTRLASLGLLQIGLVLLAALRYDLRSRYDWELASGQSGIAIALGVPMALWLNAVRWVAVARLPPT